MTSTSNDNKAKAADPARLPHALVLDVRRLPAFEKATTMLPHASWRDPGKAADWASELSAGQEVIVYCVFGHEVSQNTAIALQALGVNATFLAGGIDAWETAGNAVVLRT